MDDDHRDLANQLFATATAMLEDAAEIAASGQSPQMTASQLLDNSSRLRAATREIAVIVEAAAIIAKLGGE